jgi:DNA-directed RNA polymerase specialized sigma24 family protein
MTVKMVPAPSPPPDENDLARRLLAALADDEMAAAEELKGQILGLHLAKVRTFVARRVPGVVGEEIFGEAMVKALKALQRPKVVGWAAEPGGSFAPLLFTIASTEIIQCYRGRPPYKDDIRSTPNDELTRERLGEEVEPIAAFEDYSASRHNVGRILEAAGGLESLGAVLLVLKYGLALRFAEIESLLELAQLEDREHADLQAAELLTANHDLAAAILALLRNCEDGTAKNEGALKVALHRARTRARRALDEGVGDEDVESDDGV